MSIVVNIIGLATLIGYLAHQLLKLVTIIIICKHPELSAAKVKYLTQMVSKDKNSRKSK